ARGAAVEQVALRGEPVRERSVEYRRVEVGRFARAVRRRQVDLEDARIGRHAEPAQVRRRWWTVAFELDRDAGRRARVIDGRDQRAERVERVLRRYEHP